MKLHLMCLRFAVTLDNSSFPTFGWTKVQHRNLGSGASILSTWTGSERTRGNELKQGRFRVDIRKKFMSVHKGRIS